MKLIGLCGHYGKNRNLLNGQTIKTKIVTEELKNHFDSNQFMIVDTHGNKLRMIIVLLQMLYMMIRCKNIIIFPAHNGVRILAPYLVFLNKIFKRKLHYVVIGGWLPEFLENRKNLSDNLKKFNYIYVETNMMKTKLNKLGFKNIEVMPNCKKLNILSEDELNINFEKPYKLCTFSRVMKEKGIEDAIDVVKKINEESNEIIYTLDIYGQIDENYKEKFEQLKQHFPDYIRYCGLVDFDKTTDILKDYFLLLFPTYYEGEGFAGTLIDAMAAGIPVIASDWKYNSEIIKDDYNGYIVKNVQELYLKLKNTISNKKINIIRKNNINTAKKYYPCNALLNLLKNIYNRS